MESENVQEYLEAIYSINEGGKSAETVELAKMLNITPPSVTEMLKRLTKEGYVDYKPYKGAKLTESGLRVALKITRKHGIIERFLHDVLKLKREEAHQQACLMEHSLGDKAEAALCRLLGRPEKRLNDDKQLPPCDIHVSNCIECEEMALNDIKKRIRRPKAITSLKRDQVGVIAFIRGGRQGVKRLSDLGLTVGTQVTLLNSAPFGGPIEISVRGSKLAIGRGLANKVFVETIDDL